MKTKANKILKEVKTTLKLFDGSKNTAQAEETNNIEKKLFAKQVDLAKTLSNNVTVAAKYGDDPNFEIHQKIRETVKSYEFFKSTLEDLPTNDADHFEQSLLHLLQK